MPPNKPEERQRAKEILSPPAAVERQHVPGAFRHGFQVSILSLQINHLGMK